MTHNSNFIIYFKKCLFVKLKNDWSINNQDLGKRISSNFKISQYNVFNIDYYDVIVGDPQPVLHMLIDLGPLNHWTLSFHEYSS